MATSADYIPGVDGTGKAKKPRTRKAKQPTEVREESKPQTQNTAREDLEKEELKHAYEREKQENESLRTALELARTEFAVYANGVSGPLAWVLVYRNPGTLQGEMFFSPELSPEGVIGLLSEVAQRYIEEQNG